MLTPVPDGPAIVVCVTCRRGDDRGGGAALAAALRAAAAADRRYAAIAVQETTCLFACREACAVHLRAPGKIGYVLGRFAADDGARAILDYAADYAESATGEVAFARWPEGVKGHFLTRTPPAGFVIG